MTELSSYFRKNPRELPKYIDQVEKELQREISGADSKKNCAQSLLDKITNTKKEVEK